MGSKKNEITSTFAQWVSKPHYNVTFNQGDHGTISSGNVVDRYEGQMITNSDVPTVKPNGHYTFKGWNPEFTEHAVTSNETYTAVYEYVAATVHFNTNGGETINDVIVDQNSKVENINNPRHKSGIFVGWYNDSGLQNAVDLSTWRMPTPAVETTFYAKWDMNAAKVIVSYVVNGGTAKPASVVKVLQKDGWANVGGSSTLVTSDIPSISANTGYDINLISYNPKAPEVGDVITKSTTYTITLDKISISIAIALGTEMKLTSGQLSQTVKYGDQLAQTIITCSDGYSWSDDDILNIQKALPFTANMNEHKTILTLSGAVRTTNKNIAHTIPSPTPTVNYKPEAGNNLALVSIKEASGSYTNWTQWSGPTSVIPKYDFSKPMRLNYTNLQTGGLNAAWAMFGDHPLSNLTMSNNGSISTSTNQVEIDWGFSPEQVDLVNSHIGEVVMLYDDAGKKSGFVFEVSGASASKKKGIVRFVDWPNIADVALKAGECLWDTSYNYETHELIDIYNTAHPDKPCTWVESTLYPNASFDATHLYMPDPPIDINVVAKFGTPPKDYGVVTIDNSPNGNVLSIDWYPEDGFDIQMSNGHMPLSNDGFFMELYLEPDFKTLVYSLITEHPTLGGPEHWWMSYPPKDMTMYAKFVKDESKYLTIVWGRDPNMNNFAWDPKWKTPIPFKVIDNGKSYPVNPDLDLSTYDVGLTIGDLESNRPLYSANYVDIQMWEPDPNYSHSFDLVFDGSGGEYWNNVSIYEPDDTIVPISYPTSGEYRLYYTGWGDIEPPPPDSPTTPDEPGPGK